MEKYRIVTDVSAVEGAETESRGPVVPTFCPFAAGGMRSCRQVVARHHLLSLFDVEPETTNFSLDSLREDGSIELATMIGLLRRFWGTLGRQ